MAQVKSLQWANFIVKMKKRKYGYNLYTIKNNFFISYKEYILKVESACPTIKILLITKVYKTKRKQIYMSFSSFHQLQYFNLE
jgi:hypothetical protein